MSEHDHDFEYAENVKVDDRLLEAIMLSVPPVPGAHFAGMICVSFWHKPDGEMQSAVLVHPQDQRKAVVHSSRHILDEIIDSGTL